MAPLAVDPEALSGAGTAVGAVGDGLVTAMAALMAAFNTNTGQDAAGVLFGRQYANTGGDLLKAVAAGINACRNTGYGIQVTAANYSRAEAASDVSGRSQPLPTPPCPAPTSAPGPPSPTGGGVAEPMLWAVVEFLVGDLWPNGDAAAMRTAAASWRTFSTALYHVSSANSGAYTVVGAQQMPEGEIIKASVRDIGTLLSSVAGTCQTMASELDSFAADVEQTQQAIRDLLTKLGSIGGVAGTFFEFLKGHGEDELDEIADDIKTVLGHLKTEAAAKSALVEAAKQNVDGWAVSLEKFADRKFVDFFGEDVGRVLGAGFHAFVDAREGDFRWAVGMAEGIQGMNPLRFAYDPQGALQTWKGLSDTAALLNPSTLAASVASDPEGVEDILKGLARTDEFDPNRPMLSLEQNMLDVASLGIPGVGEAGAGADAAGAAARAARAGEVADEAAGVARTAGSAGELTRAASTLGDISKQSAGISSKLDDIAKSPVTREPPPGGRPVPPTGPFEAPPPPVVKQPIPESAPPETPRAPVLSESPSATAPPAPHEAPPPIERVPASAPAEVPHAPAPSAADHPVEPGDHHGMGDHERHGDGNDGGGYDGATGPPEPLPNDISSPAEFDPNTLRGMPADQVRALIPDNWEYRPAKRGDGDIFKDPVHDGRQIRIMEGYPAGSRPNDINLGPYVVVSQNGERLKIPLAGNPTLKGMK